MQKVARPVPLMPMPEKGIEREGLIYSELWHLQEGAWVLLLPWNRVRFTGKLWNQFCPWLYIWWELFPDPDQDKSLWMRAILRQWLMCQFSGTLTLGSWRNASLSTKGEIWAVYLSIYYKQLQTCRTFTLMYFIELKF
jgi:hypothetical protein